MKFLQSLSQFLVDFIEAGGVIRVHETAQYCCTGCTGLCDSDRA